VVITFIKILSLLLILIRLSSHFTYI